MSLEFSAIENDEAAGKVLGKIHPSGLYKLLQSPEEYRLPFEASDAMDFGTIVDSMLLPSGEPAPFLEIPKEVLSASGSRAGGAWKAFEAANKHKILVKSDTIDRARRVCEAVRAVPIIREKLEAAGNQFQSRLKAKVTCEVEGQEYAAIMSAKLDILNPNFIIDLKVHGKGELNKWLKSAEWDFGYHVQGAAYQYLRALQDGEELPVYFIVVEDDGLMRAELVEITPFRMEVGMNLFRRATQDWFRRTVTGDWNRETYNRVVKW